MSATEIHLKNLALDMQRKHRAGKRANVKLNAKLDKIRTLAVESQKLKNDPTNSFTAADLGCHYDQVITDILALIDN